MLALSALGVLAARAESNIDPAHAVHSSPVAGILDWRIDGSSGVAVAASYCSGYIFGQQVGWIRLGSGRPADGYHYRNDSPTDFGVNVLAAGELRGFAYGANIGWLTFGDEGHPHVDPTDGRLRGRIWSANLGWIDLDAGSTYVRLSAPLPGADADRDGLADSWELEFSGRLSAFSATGDFDRDGASDLNEFGSGTDPTDPTDYLAVQISTVVGGGTIHLRWISQTGQRYAIDQRPQFEPATPWSPWASQIWTGDGDLLTVELSPVPDPARFFRVRVLPAGSDAYNYYVMY